MIVGCAIGLAFPKLSFKNILKYFIFKRGLSSQKKLLQFIIGAFIIIDNRYLLASF